MGTLALDPCVPVALASAAPDQHCSGRSSEHRVETRPPVLLVGGEPDPDRVLRAARREPVVAAREVAAVSLDFFVRAVRDLVVGALPALGHRLARRERRSVVEKVDIHEGALGHRASSIQSSSSSSTKSVVGSGSASPRSAATSRLSRTPPASPFGPGLCFERGVDRAVFAVFRVLVFAMEPSPSWWSDPCPRPPTQSLR